MTNFLQELLKLRYGLLAFAAMCSAQIQQTIPQLPLHNQPCSRQMPQSRWRWEKQCSCSKRTWAVISSLFHVWAAPLETPSSNRFRNSANCSFCLWAFPSSNASIKCQTEEVQARGKVSPRPCQSSRTGELESDGSQTRLHTIPSEQHIHARVFPLCFLHAAKPG